MQPMHAAYKKIIIRTVDTDVVLAMALACMPKEEIELWVSISSQYGEVFPHLGRP